MQTENLKRTPLYESHKQLGAKMVPFAGWEMPVQYSNLKEEHLCVRKSVGLFDVSHMGEIRFRGPKALATLQWALSNDVAKLEAGRAQYSALMNASGGFVDDVITYCIEKNSDYLVCVNASNSDKDFAAFQKANKGCDIANESSSWGQIAVQGPKAFALVEKVFQDKTLSQMAKNEFKKYRDWGSEILVARTGYTGEDGVEIFVSSEKTSDLWNALLEKGQEFGVKPIGLGARDTLRVEMKYPLYGQEITETTSPIEAGLGWAVKPEAKDFLGKAEVQKILKAGAQRRLVGFKLLEKGIPRTGYRLFSFDSQEIGTVTSGTLSPVLDEGIGIGYVTANAAAVGTNILVEIRSKMFKAQIVKTPFVDVNR